MGAQSEIGTDSHLKVHASPFSEIGESVLEWIWRTSSEFTQIRRMKIWCIWTILQFKRLKDSGHRPRNKNISVIDYAIIGVFNFKITEFLCENNNIRYIILLLLLHILLIRETKTYAKFFANMHYFNFALLMKTESRNNWSGKQLAFSFSVCHWFEAFSWLLDFNSSHVFV